MSKPRECIVGAGLAGLIAAHAWPRAVIREAAPGPAAVHRALLRFRTEAVSALTGVPFRRVLVHKSVWAGGAHQQPTIRTANLYAHKVLGALVGERSIWNTDAVQRWVAPESLYEQLIDAAAPRIDWGTPFDYGARRPGPVVSTAPLPVVLAECGIGHKIEFQRAPITVVRMRVPRADVFQTVYFPEHGHSAYRASITKDLLIVEHNCPEPWGLWTEDVFDAFGIDHADTIDSVAQAYGKIAPVDDAARKAMLFRLTTERGVYSLGRFATWRNILLDDVVHDISVVKGMINGASSYDLHRAAST